MKDYELSNLIKKIKRADTDNFVSLVRLAGLDPTRDFRHANLSGVDFAHTDLSGFDFTEARMDNCSFRDCRLGNAVFTNATVEPEALSLADDYGGKSSSLPVHPGRALGIRDYEFEVRSTRPSRRNSLGSVPPLLRQWPNFGSPTFIKHVGIWPIQSNEALSEERFLDAVNDFLIALQKRGRVESLPIDVLAVDRPVIGDGSFKEDEYAGAPNDFTPQSLAFTIWWKDSENSASNERIVIPSFADIRVRVQVEIDIDHARISFYIDVSKPYGSPPIYLYTDSINHASSGYRRSMIINYLNSLRQISVNQIKSGFVETNYLPERGISEEDGEVLSKVSKYFYDIIWYEFMNSFNIRTDGDGTISIIDDGREVQLPGEIFSHSHGVVLATEGLRTPKNIALEYQAAQLRQELDIAVSSNEIADRSANTGIGQAPTFDPSANEPNAVLKSFWPFLRRVAPSADYRNCIGCGIMDWKALLFASDNTSGEVHRLDEGFIPSGNGRARLEGYSADSNGAPLRYLIISKGEPNRDEIGRYVERFDFLQCKSLAALKYLDEMRMISGGVRVLGFELDRINQQWSKRHEQIMTKPIRDSGDMQSIRTNIEIYNNSIKNAEKDLAKIAIHLDRIGGGGASRTSNLINRAEYHIAEYERLWPTLAIGNIGGWVNYGQLAERSLSPSFAYMRSTGERLLTLRRRLQVVSESIQTSALIVETESTRSNTEVLRQITRRIHLVAAPLAMLTAALAGQLLPEGLDYGNLYQFILIVVSGAATAALFFLNRTDVDKRK